MTSNRFARSQPEQTAHSVLRLQRQRGNQYVQRVLDVARSGEGDAQVTPDVEKRIESARGSGPNLKWKPITWRKQ